MLTPDEMRPCVADPDALVPRVMELGVTSTPAVSEPRTAATATTACPRFLDGAAFAAYGTDGRRRGDYWCSFDERKKQKMVRSHELMYLQHAINWT